MTEESTETSVERKLIIKIVREIMKPIGYNSRYIRRNKFGETMYDGVLNLIAGTIAQEGKSPIPNTVGQLRTPISFQIWICHDDYDGHSYVEMEISKVGGSLSLGYWCFKLSDPNCISKVQETIRGLLDARTRRSKGEVRSEHNIG
jgi:hypothetical protein